MSLRIALGASLLACACASVEREAVVDPHAAAALGSRVHVVAVNDTPIAELTVGEANDGIALYDAKGRRGAALAPSDKLDVRIAYKDGDTIPYEGVVRIGRKKLLTEIGAGIMVVGGVMGLLGSIGAVAATDYPSTNCVVIPMPSYGAVGSCTHSNADLRATFAGVGIAGAVIGGLGLTALLFGFVKFAHIDSSRVAVTPTGLALGF